MLLDAAWRVKSDVASDAACGGPHGLLGAEPWESSRGGVSQGQSVVDDVGHQRVRTFALAGVQVNGCLRRARTVILL